MRLVASMSSRVVSPSLVLLRLGSYARQNRIHQALAEIGRIRKTVHILRTLDDEEYRRRIGIFRFPITSLRQAVRSRHFTVQKRRITSDCLLYARAGLPEFWISIHGMLGFASSLNVFPTLAASIGSTRPGLSGVSITP